VILLQADRSILVHAALGVLAPGAVAVLVLALAARLRQASAEPRTVAAWGAPLALGLAFTTGYVVTQGWPPLPPQLVKHWLFYVGLGGGLFGVYEALAGQAKPFARVLCSAAAPIVLLGFMREHHWNRTESVLWTSGLAAALYAAWNALESLALRRSGGVLPLSFGLALALCAGTLHFSGASASLAALAAALVPALFACALLAWLRPGFTLARGGIAPYVLLHSGLLWAGRFASELGGWSFALSFLAPLGAWSGELVPAGRPRLRTALQLGVPPAVSLAALLIARAAAPSSPYG